MPDRTGRGTTPTFAFDIDIDLTGWDIYVTISQSQEHKFTFRDIDVVSTKTGCTLLLTLEQEDTLKFRTGKAYAQVRAVNDEEVAVRTNIMELWIDEILLDGKIPLEGE